MAVSGKKIPGFKDSLTIGSSEDFDVCCDPCKFLGKTVEGKGFCENCQENLCKRCVDAHKSTKASRHHHLLDQPQKVTGGTTAASDDSKICTTYCNIHKKEIIKFFCSHHEKVGCSDCMTLDHRTCDIDYIPDVCSGILKSTEFGRTLHNVSKALKEVKLIGQKAQLKKTENKTSVTGIIREIEKFQKKINDRIEQLKQQLVTEANLHKANRDQEVDKISDSCSRVYSALNQIDIALTDCQTKQLDTQAFVTMKHAQWLLSCTNNQTYELDLANVSTTISFEPNNDLTNTLAQQYGLGRIILSLTNVAKEERTEIDIGKAADVSITVTQECTEVLQSIKQKRNLNVKTKSDITDCCITGCAVISADRLLLADSNNHKLKIVNKDTQSLVEEMTVDPYPWDVTVLPRDEVAVTLPVKQRLLTLGTAGKLTWIRNMNNERQCLGIAYHQDYIYVVCQQPNSLLVLDMRGNVQRDIPLQTAQDQTFSNPLYIAVDKDRRTMHISDWGSNFVASLTLPGNVTDLYKHKGLKKPQGLVVMEDGSLFVCCGTSGTIHHISPDLKQGHTVIGEISHTQAICCHPNERQVCVGANDDMLGIYSYE